jgi:vacuolar-type H+-ATPase subunit D/Vma8
MLAPNKQNLLYLKKQKKVIANGLKLLREKRTSLVVMFLDLARKGRDLEQQLSRDLQQVLDRYKLSTTFASGSKLIEALAPQPALGLEVVKKRTSGVYLSHLELGLKLPERENIKLDLREGLTNFGKFFPLVLEVSQLKLNCTRISQEIEKTNRQISNLENRMEDLKAQEKFIATSLNEKANLEKATLIKLFG